MSVFTDKRALLSIVTAAILMGGCAGNTPSAEEAKAANTEKMKPLDEPARWSDAVDSGKVNGGWLKSFNDPILEKLVAEAMENNRQIRAFEAKVDQAKALVKQSAAGLKPTVGLGGGYSANTGALGDVYGGGLTASWEADVWGRVGSAVKASEAQAAATEADYIFARESLAAATAKGWYMATTAKLQSEYALSVVKLREEVVRVLEAKQKYGQVGMRDVHIARSDLATAKEAHTNAISAYEASQRSLELLLGRYPSAQVEGASGLSSVPAPVPVGIPSELLERRPDLIAAEERAAAAFFKQREAELLHLPSFTFSLGAGINNLNDAIASLGAGLFAPLYTGGAIEAEVERATAVQTESIENYAQKALTAFKEVETCLSLESRLADQESFLKSAVDENKEALKMTKSLYDAGQIDYLEVSQVEGRLIAAEIALLDMSSKRLFNRIDLSLALGGGFEATK
jgi:NodT family efflux transporter outer membrane factor (OMF) lipoprotein